jgi:hypothetical protein
MGSSSNEMAQIGVSAPSQFVATDHLVFVSSVILLCLVVGLFAGFARFSAPHVLP